MHIKRFEAADLPSALQRVREELGREALILSTRSVRRQGSFFGLLSKPSVEVVAAVDRAHRVPRTPSEAPAETSAPAVSADPSWNGLLASKALLDPLYADVRVLRRELEAVRGSRDETAALRGEIRALRQAILRSPGGVSRCDDEPFASTLRAMGVDPGHATSIGAEAGRRSVEGEGDAGEVLRQALADRLDPRLLPPREAEEDRTRVVVGPTGVGKTTSVAKIVGWSHPRDEVALITTDTSRVGGDSVLQGFARATGLPFRRAATGEDLASQVSKCGRRHVWVDTAGRSRNDPAAIADLLAIRQALGRRARFDLVLSATTRESDLRAAVDRHRCLEPESLIVTHLDESDDIANVLNVILDPGTPPLAWAGTGQGVPDDLQIPDPADLAGRLLGGVA